jgi:hypothetical protein
MVLEGEGSILGGGENVSRKAGAEKWARCNDEACWETEAAVKVADKGSTVVGARNADRAGDVVAIMAKIWCQEGISRKAEIRWRR